MKRSIQIILIVACSVFVNAFKAADDTKKMISIKGMGNDLAALNVSMTYDDATTIKEIKEYIYSEKKIPVDSQVLYKIEVGNSPFLHQMRRFRELQDDQTCADYNIQERTILGLCLK